MNSNNILWTRHFFLFIFLLSAVKQINAQTFNTITHKSGTMVVGSGNNQSSVTVTSFGNPHPLAPLQTCPPDYRLGGIVNPPAIKIDGYRYSFSPAAHKIRLLIPGLDSGETITVYINGSKYMLSNSNLSAHPCYSSATLATTINGSVTNNVTGFVIAYGQVNINPGFPIDSVTVEGSGWSALGYAYNIAFVIDTIAYINRPFTDTLLCANDSFFLNYKVGLKFNSSNVFTAQLSDASGNFSSPVNIGSISSDTAGVIPCKIPSGASGNGYRLRIIASSPARTSVDNGVNIKISNLMPANLTVSNSGPVCEGSSLNLTSSSTTNGVSYKWTGPGSFTSTSQNPVINPTTASSAGTYSVIVSLNGCKDTATTTVQVKPVPATPVAGNSGPVCIGGSITLTASSGTPGVSYNWNGPMGYSSTAQNPVLSSVTTGMSGSYTVTALLNGCSSASTSTNVAITAGPKIYVFPSPGNKVCKDDSITFIGIAVDTNTGTTFQWLKNGTPIAGANGLKYKSGGFVNGDIVTCELIPGPGSSCNGPISSLPIPLIILDYKAPSVTIAVSPGIDVWENLLVTFTANTTDAGTNPLYQWKRNGQDVVGATGKEWSATTLTNGDEVTCEVISKYECPQPATAISNAIKMSVRLSVNELKDGTLLSIYPNPVTDVLYITPATDDAYAITDITGRTIKEGTVSQNQGRIQVYELTPGMYFLNIYTEDKPTRIKFNKL